MIKKIVLKLISLNIMLILASQVAYSGGLCTAIVVDTVKISDANLEKIDQVESRINSRIQSLPNAKEFIASDHQKVVEEVKVLLPKILPDFNEFVSPKVIFVNSMIEFYKLRDKNISHNFVKFSGGNHSDITTAFVTNDNSFYDPYENTVVVNINAFSTFLKVFSGLKEPTVDQYTLALKIFLSHELTHSYQEAKYKMVSKMIESGPMQVDLSVLLDGHAVYVQELFAKKINASGFLLNIHQQAYKNSGYYNITLGKIIEESLLALSNHGTKTKDYWKKLKRKFKTLYKQSILNDVRVSKLNHFGDTERSIVEEIWREGRVDEFTRPLKLFNSELSPDGKSAKEYNEIISEAQKLKEGHLDTNISFIYKADEVIGFYRVVKSGEGIEIDQMYISRKMRGKGIGAFAMNHIINEFGSKPIELYVLKDNPAVKFYERFGFGVTESLKIPKSSYKYIPELPVYKMTR